MFNFHALKAEMTAKAKWLKKATQCTKEDKQNDLHYALRVAADTVDDAKSEGLVSEKRAARYRHWLALHYMKCMVIAKYPVSVHGIAYPTHF